MCTRTLFQSRGPAAAKARSPSREFVLIMARLLDFYRALKTQHNASVLYYRPSSLLFGALPTV